jgi:hypothetical protein
MVVPLRDTVPFVACGPDAMAETAATVSVSLSTSVSLARRVAASPTAHAYYLIAAAIVSTIVIATLRETAHEELA